MLAASQRGEGGGEMGGALVLRRAAWTILVRLIRSSATALITPQIVARTGLSRPVVTRHLAELERGI